MEHHRPNDLQNSHAHKSIYAAPLHQRRSDNRPSENKLNTVPKDTPHNKLRHSTKDRSKRITNVPSNLKPSHERQGALRAPRERHRALQWPQDQDKLKKERTCISVRNQDTRVDAGASWMESLRHYEGVVISGKDHDHRPNGGRSGITCHGRSLSSASSKAQLSNLAGVLKNRSVSEADTRALDDVSQLPIASEEKNALQVNTWLHFVGQLQNIHRHGALAAFPRVELQATRYDGHITLLGIGTYMDAVWNMGSLSADIIDDWIMKHVNLHSVSSIDTSGEKFRSGEYQPSAMPGKGTVVPPDLLFPASLSPEVEVTDVAPQLDERESFTPFEHFDPEKNKIKEDADTGDDLKSTSLPSQPHSEKLRPELTVPKQPTAQESFNPRDEADNRRNGTDSNVALEDANHESDDIANRMPWMLPPEKIIKRSTSTVILIRDVERADLFSCMMVYNYYIQYTTSTKHIQIFDMEDWKHAYDKSRRDGYPFVVAVAYQAEKCKTSLGETTIKEVEDAQRVMMGFALTSPYDPEPGNIFEGSARVIVHVRPSCLRSGIGSRLLDGALHCLQPYSYQPRFCGSREDKERSDILYELTIAHAPFHTIAVDCFTGNVGRRELGWKMRCLERYGFKARAWSTSLARKAKAPITVVTLLRSLTSNTVPDQLNDELVSQSCAANDRNSASADGSDRKDQE